ncbi:MAG: hypothetical protein ACI814_002464 [Mariniblastus sp.]
MRRLDVAVGSYQPSFELQNFFGMKMSKYWMLVLALAVFTCGCNGKSQEKIKTEMEAANAHVADALEKAKNAPQTGPKMGGPPPAGLAPETKPEKAKDDAPASGAPAAGAPASGAPAAGAPAEKEEGADKTDTSLKVNASSVLDAAVASAKSEDKVLFVHFTAAW